MQFQWYFAPLILILWNIFAIFLNEMGLQESTKGNAQLTRENDIFHINQTSVLFNRDSTYSLVRKCICFFKKRHHTAKAVLHWVPRDPNTIFLVSTFTLKVPESSDSTYFSFFLLENIWYHHFTWSGLNSKDIVSFVPIMSPEGPKLNW